MKNIICFLLIIFTVPAADAQYNRIDKRIDSLKSLFKQEKTDTGKIQKLIYIGNAYWNKNDTALIYYKDALRWSEQIGYKRGEIRSRSNIADFLAYINSDYATALELYLYNLKLEEQTGDSAYLFNDTRNVCIIYGRIEDNQKQFEYIKKLRHLVNSGLFKDSATLARYRGVVDTQLGEFYGKLNNHDSSKYFMARVLQYGISSKNLLRIAAGGLGLGKIYKEQKKYDSAFHYFRIGLHAALQRSNKANKDVYINGLIMMGNLHWEMNQTDSAFYYAEKAFKLSQGTLPDHLQMINAAELLAKIYYAKKQPDSAYKYLSRSMLLKDSIFTSEKFAKVQNLSLQESLDKLKQEQTKKEAVQEYKSRIKIYSLVAGLAGLLIFIFILYRNNRQRLIANKKIEKAYTDLKATQAQLVQKEKMASLGELTAGIAHEIQNPLNFVNNFSEVSTELIEELREEQKKHPRDMQAEDEIVNGIEQNLEKINHHGKRADAIVKNMLQHSRSSTGKKEPSNINALADEYLRLSYQGLRAKNKDFNAILTTDFDKNIGKIEVVPQDIGRVLLNLYNNAFYSVNEKKKQLNGTYEPTVEITTKKLNNKIILSVKDNGTGIPQIVLDKIYQPFFTTKPTGHGTGLGLSLSYDIIKAHGGELNVETKEGEYAEFVVQLPV